MEMTEKEHEGYIEALSRIKKCQVIGGKSLDLSGLRLTSLPDELFQLTSLHSLDLSFNFLQILPSSWGYLASLVMLDLNSNQLLELPSELGQLALLQELNLSYNTLKTLPSELGLLTKLRILFLSGNQLNSLPAELEQLTNLRALVVRDNHLLELPSALGKLTLLQELDLSENLLEELPNELGQLSELKFFNLNNNQLRKLPREFGQLTSLEKLEVSDNQLHTLPADLGKLNKLKDFNISGNQLHKLPSELCQLSALSSLSLSYNLIRELPRDLAQLTQLKALQLQSNDLHDLPSSIGHLAELKELYLGNNQIKDLPPEMGLLTKLKALDVNNNQLKGLPPELGLLRTLLLLDLSDNELKELPLELGKLSGLKQIYLQDNPDLDLPSDVLGPTHLQVSIVKGMLPASPKAILDYYFARQEQGEKPMQELRILLVGRGRVGKTSLINRLKGKAFNQLENETGGICVDKIEVSCSQGVATGHLWDFGGQEFLHGTHQIFLSERCLYLLVLEGREGNWETETDYWLRFIQSFGGDSPVLIVLNKFDQHPFSIDQHRLKERCPEIVGFVETDASTDLGIRQLENLISATVAEMKDVWLGVPKKWHAVKVALEEMHQSFFEYSEYVSLCNKQGIFEQQHQESLAISLHHLGIALNFRDHHRLRHTSVLKPAWLTNAIYGLIRFAQKKDCHGILEKRWLHEALKPSEDYPPERYDYVLDLMAKFEVAFTLDEIGTRWLIPELLPETQPEAFTQFRSERVKRLRFTYPDALPAGLLPRLIVRTHEMSEKHQEWRWRTGVVLEWQGCQALVRLNRLQRQTEVIVIGTDLTAQQGLFDIIRSHLTELHGKLRAIEETEIEDHRGTWVKVPTLRRKKADNKREMEQETEQGEPVIVQVSPTLVQVESPDATEAVSKNPPARMKLFISYAHDNEKELFPIRQHLTLLSQQGFIQVWHDRNLVAGEKWEDGIMEELQSADIVLIFYTTKARVSHFIQEKELKISLDRSDAGECTIIWVPLERNDLDNEHALEKRLGALQCATRDAKKIYDFDPPCIGWMQVEDSIRKAVLKRREKERAN